jgi:hypothetical protein
MSNMVDSHSRASSGAGSWRSAIAPNRSAPVPAGRRHVPSNVPAYRQIVVALVRNLAHRAEAA